MEGIVARTAAERQAEFRAKRGRQLAVPLSEAAWSRLEALARDAGVSQRQALERLLTAPPAESAPAAPAPVTGEILSLRRHIADLDHAHKTVMEENRRLEGHISRVTIRAIAAERRLEFLVERPVIGQPFAFPNLLQKGQELFQWRKKGLGHGDRLDPVIRGVRRVRRRPRRQDRRRSKSSRRSRRNLGNRGE